MTENRSFPPEPGYVAAWLIEEARWHAEDWRAVYIADVGGTDQQGWYDEHQFPWESEPHQVER